MKKGLAEKAKAFFHSFTINELAAKTSQKSHKESSFGSNNAKTILVFLLTRLAAITQKQIQRDIADIMVYHDLQHTLILDAEMFVC